MNPTSLCDKCAEGYLGDNSGGYCTVCAINNCKRCGTNSFTLCD